MRFITLFAGTLVATTAANILLASDAHAGFPPNGWSQVGKSCEWDGNTYHKLRKNSQQSKYGVYRNKKTWQNKGMKLADVNTKMEELCNCNGSSVAAIIQGCSYGE